MSNGKIRWFMLVMFFVISYLLSTATMLYLQATNVEAQCRYIPQIVVEWTTANVEADCHNEPCSDKQPLAGLTQRYCALAQVQFEDNNDRSEWARCNIWRDAGRWYIEAALGATGNADAWCRARCFRW